MESNILCKQLNKTIEDIEFVLKKDDKDKETICAEIDLEDKHLFSLRIYITNDQVKTYFDFGKIRYNHKALFFVNNFNYVSNGEFIAFINEDTNLMRGYGQFHILFETNEESVAKAAKDINYATEKLFCKSLEKSLFPLINLLDNSKIPNLNSMN